MAVAVTAFAVRTSAGQVQVGPNVNIAGGPAGCLVDRDLDGEKELVSCDSVTPGEAFEILGDPFLQRQNEPSIAASSRNPLHLFAGANDYRTVDVPGLPEDLETGDAWLGVFWSRNAGRSWRSTLMPGFLQDNSPEGLASPLKGFEAGADPTVRAGSNGLLYYSGIAFNRDPVDAEGKKGVLFLALYVDDNNTQDLDTPFRYIRQVIVDNGSSGQFLDKPWLAVDVPRGGGTCDVPGNSAPIPAGNVYMTYTTFVGGDNNVHSKLMFIRSSDCGETWDQPTKLSEGIELNQSAIIAIDPATGNLLVAWREFATKGDPGRILASRSDRDRQSPAPCTRRALVLSRSR